MEEEDEYDYDIYDEESDSGFGGNDVATRPPPSAGSPGGTRPPPPGNPDKEEGTEKEEEFEVVSGSIFQCPAPGFYPHEDNCREFYVCQGGNIRIRGQFTKDIS